MEFTSLTKAAKDPSAVTTLRLTKRAQTLKKWPDEIGLMKNLEALTLRNRFRSLPEDFPALKKLKTMVLGEGHSVGRSLSSLPAAFGALKKLEELTLRDYAFREFPEPLTGCKKLEKLSFRCTKMKDLTGIGSLTKLRELDLGYTQVKALPAEIEKLKRLEVLDLCGSHRTSIANVEEVVELLAGFKKLRVLNLDYTRMKRFPEALAKCKKLEVLSVRHNKGVEAPPDFVKALPNIQQVMYGQSRSRPKIWKKK